MDEEAAVVVAVDATSAQEGVVANYLARLNVGESQGRTSHRPCQMARPEAPSQNPIVLL